MTIEDYVTGNGTRLLRTAFLLTGDRHAAEDLVQTALLKVWPKWDRVVRTGTPDGYVRRTLLTTYLSWRRRPAFFERPAELSDAAADSADHDLRLALLDALATLPRRQRATIVLRYLDDLSAADTAAVLGCSVGTVKSQSAKAIRSLRARLGDLELEVHRDR
jgi:RNA polymerase sigma-70 factor (sigma-E family)